MITEFMYTFYSAIHNAFASMIRSHIKYTDELQKPKLVTNCCPGTTVEEMISHWEPSNDDIFDDFYLKCCSNHQDDLVSRIAPPLEGVKWTAQKNGRLWYREKISSFPDVRMSSYCKRTHYDLRVSKRIEFNTYWFCIDYKKTETFTHLNEPDNGFKGRITPVEQRSSLEGNP